MSETYIINCPIRGQIKIGKKAKGLLKPSEEFYRVEAIKYLIKMGYPASNIKLEPIVKKFGNSGRNSFRSDFAVLDVEVAQIKTNDPDALLEHAILLGEVKRENNKADYVINTQVKPMLDFSKLDNCIGIYWDNIEQRVFWKKNEEGKRTVYEGALQFLPKYGSAIETKFFTYADLVKVDSLIDMFDRIEDILHQASFDKSERYSIILQLILVKIFDEHSHAGRLTEDLEFQDFKSLGISPSTALKNINKTLGRAVSFYEQHLPNKVFKTFPFDGDILLEISKILAPILITRSKRDVVQTFYMKFAKDLYKWDLAQFFTPTQVTDFIIDVLNPQFGEHVYDPACGSADFLVGAFHKLRQYNPGFADCIWGSDNSANAVQVAILNMLLNGDGKTNIHKVDSLETLNDRLNKYDIVVCNPPFGTKIVEKRKHILKNFDLSHNWTIEDGFYKKKESSLLDSQETGILFAELCIKQAKPDTGRIALIVPNGYLGNRSDKYRIFREWLLRHTKIAGIVGFPRFTFKSSGADVSASVVFLQKRERPLERIDKKESYPIFIQLVENVGWEASNKRASIIYKRDPTDGSLVVDDGGNCIVDSDFEKVLKNIQNSLCITEFDWIGKSRNITGWSIDSTRILVDSDLTLDPKRYSQKFVELQSYYNSVEHIKLGEIVDFYVEKKNLSGSTVKVLPSKEYRYVELQNIGQGDYDYVTMKGWQLPSRAKHFASPGDIYFASIWSSVDKWCYVGNDADNIVVTNGCVRCRIKNGYENWLIDLIFFMCTEGWTSQLRALARGSDGLAEINIIDMQNVIVPKLDSLVLRESIKNYAAALESGRTTLNNAVDDMIRKSETKIAHPTKRNSHIYLV